MGKNTAESEIARAKNIALSVIFLTGGALGFGVGYFAGARSASTDVPGVSDGTSIGAAQPKSSGASAPRLVPVEGNPFVQFDHMAPSSQGRQTATGATPRLPPPVGSAEGAELAPQTFPAGRVLFLGTGDRVAPFAVTAPSGSDVLVRLESTRTKKGALDIYIGRGRTVKTDVPIGAFRVKFALGEQWFGRRQLFGPQTLTSEADRIATFEATPSGYKGVTIVLELRSDGNLNRAPISRAAFEQ